MDLLFCDLDDYFYYKDRSLAISVNYQCDILNKAMFSLSRQFASLHAPEWKAKPIPCEHSVHPIPLLLKDVF